MIKLKKLIALCLLYFMQAFSQSGQYVLWHSGLNFRAAGPNAQNLIITCTGDPGLYPNISSTQTGGNKLITMGMTMPGSVKMDSLIIFYRVSNSATSITTVRLFQMVSAVNSLNLLEDNTNLNSTMSGRHAYSLPVNYANVKGPVVVNCTLSFADITHYISVQAIGIVVTPIQTIMSMQQSRVESPGSFSLAQNFPNPFNPTTQIEYTIPHQDQAVIRIYNSLGQLVRLLEEPLRPAGTYAIRWDGADGHGQAVASGQYYYQVQASENVASKRMLMIK